MVGHSIEEKIKNVSENKTIEYLMDSPLDEQGIPRASCSRSHKKELNPKEMK